MPLIPFLHQAYGKTNFFCEKRPVFQAGANYAESVAEDSLENLKQEKEALITNLETEADFVKRADIKRRIEEIESQIEELEKSDFSNVPVLLLNSFQNNVTDIETSLSTEKDISKRKILEEKKEACMNSLKLFKSPVTTPDKLRETVLEIESDDLILKRLEEGTFDYNHADYLLRSDIRPFLDNDFEQKLVFAAEQMVTNDFIANTIRPKYEDLVLESDEDWFKYQKNIEDHVVELQQEQQAITEQLPSADRQKKRQLKERKKEIKQLLPLLIKQSKERSKWTHKQIIKKEKKMSLASLTGAVDPDVLERIRLLIFEARYMRIKKGSEYLKNRISKSQKTFEENKGSFSRKQQKEIDTVFKCSDEWFVKLDSEPEKSAELLNDLDKRLDLFEGHFNEIMGKVSGKKEDKPETEADTGDIKSNVLSQFKNAEGIISNLDTNKVQQLRRQLNQEEVKRRQSVEDGESPYKATKYDKRGELSPVFLQANTALKELELPGSPLRTRIAEIGRQLENSDDLSVHELKRIEQDLAFLAPKIEVLNNLDENIEKALDPDYQASKNAHIAIEELDNAHDFDEIKEILISNLGAEHIKMVSDHDFEHYQRKPGMPEKNLKTISAGQMAFYHDDSSNEFEIIINREALIDENTGEIKQGLLKLIKKQIIHELLHLEFRKNKDVQNKVRSAIKEKDPEKWEDIKPAFIAMADDEGRPPTHGDTWKNEDILSELYAMQNEIGKGYVENADTPRKELNNLLCDIGGAGILASSKKINSLKEDNGVFEGYMEGLEDDSGGGEESDGGTVEDSNAGYQDNKVKIDAIKERLLDIEKAGFLSQVPKGQESFDILEKYVNNTESLNEKFKSNGDNTIMASSIEERIEDSENVLYELAKLSDQANEDSPNTGINPLRNLWIKTTFMSISDIVQVGIQVKEFFQRRHKRLGEDHAAKLGMSLFGNTTLGREALAREQKAEAEEVNEWKSRYETLDAWQLMKEIEKMAAGVDPSKDQLKAVLRILADKGRIDWRDENLWIILNKLQNAAYLKPGDGTILRNPPLMRQKLHTALGEIWDYDEYLSLERQNESNYESEKQKYNPSLDRIQDQLTGRLEQLYNIHKSGGRVDPMEYEAALEYGIVNGKSYSEAVFFYLMAGMAEGLLTPDRGQVLDKHLNIWPSIEWITSQKPPLTKDKYKWYCNKYFGDEFKKGEVGPDFKNFYWTQIQNTQTVKDRVRKSVNERKWDHDWTRGIACLGDANTVKSFLRGRSGEQAAKDTAVENGVAGTLQWFEENAKNPESTNWRDNFNRQIGVMAMMDGMLTSCAYTVKDNDSNARYNESILSTQPREGFCTNHDGWTVREHRDHIRKFMDSIDSGFFRLIRDETIGADETNQNTQLEKIKNHLNNNYGAKMSGVLPKINNLNNVFDNIDEIVKIITSSIGDNDFLNRIKGTLT